MPGTEIPTKVGETMKKLGALILLLSLSGCISTEDFDYYGHVGEEIPPVCIRGKTYDKAESLKPATKRSQWSTAAQWFWSIIGEVLKK
jgi:hypothetical protein